MDRIGWDGAQIQIVIALYTDHFSGQAWQRRLQQYGERAAITMVTPRAGEVSHSVRRRRYRCRFD